MDTGLIIQNEFLRQQVQNFPVGGESDRPGFIHGLTNFVAGNLARTGSKAHAAVAIHAAYMRPCDSQQRVFNGSAGRVFSLFDGTLNRSYRLVQIDDDALARATRLCHSMSAIAQAGIGDLGHQNAGLGASNIDCR